MLKPLVKGLKVRLNSNTAQKVELTVPADDTLEVSPTVAAQLAAANSHFEVDADALAAGLAAEREAAEAAQEAEETADETPEEEVKPKPAKRAAKRA